MGRDTIKNEELMTRGKRETDGEGALAFMLGKPSEGVWNLDDVVCLVLMIYCDSRNRADEKEKGGAEEEQTGRKANSGSEDRRSGQAKR
jgi:hypothetical protein